MKVVKMNLDNYLDNVDMRTLDEVMDSEEFKGDMKLLIHDECKEEITSEDLKEYNENIFANYGF